MKRVFISQPMRNKTKEEIKLERAYLMQYAREKYDNDVRFIDSYFEDLPEDTKPLYFLGRSIGLLSVADVAIFAKGYEEARGCKIEFICAKEYGIEEIIEM